MSTPLATYTLLQAGVGDYVSIIPYVFKRGRPNYMTTYYDELFDLTPLRQLTTDEVRKVLNWLFDNGFKTYGVKAQHNQNVTVLLGTSRPIRVRRNSHV